MQYLISVPDRSIYRSLVGQSLFSSSQLTIQMKLLAFVSLALSCVYAADSLPSYRFHREAIAANLANDAALSQLSLNIDNYLRLVDEGHAIDNLSEDVKFVLGSAQQRNARLDVMRKLDGNDLRKRIYADRDRHDGISGVFRWKRKTASSQEPHLYFKPKQQLKRNSIVSLQQDTGDHDARSAFGAHVDEIEQEINYRRRRDKILPLSDYIMCW